MAQKVQYNTTQKPALIPDGPAVQEQWRSMSTIKVGRYGKYLARQELVRLGLDVCPTAIPDHNVDIVVRSNDGLTYADVQVRTLRRWSTYFFITDDEFPPKDDIYLALVVLPEGSSPKYCLLPRSAWGEGQPNYLVHRDCIGCKSRPECGIRMSGRVMEAIVQDYPMESVAALLR